MVTPPGFENDPNFRPPEGFGAASGPSLGAGPESDPGFLASLGKPTPLGQIRVLVLTLAVAPVLIGVVIAFAIPEDSGPGMVFAYPVLLAAAVIAALLAPRYPRPLDPGADQNLSGERLAERSAGLLRHAVTMRFALCETPILIGVVFSFMSQSRLPFGIGFLLGWPLLLWLTLPTRGMIERVRRRLESQGRPSHLWAALLSPPRG